MQFTWPARASCAVCAWNWGSYSTTDCNTSGICSKRDLGAISRIQLQLVWTWEQPVGWSFQLPMLAQDHQQLLGQNRVALLGSLAMADADIRATA